MKTIYEIKLQKARIDTERIRSGLEPIYGSSEKELNAKQAKVHREHNAKHPKATS